MPLHLGKKVCLTSHSRSAYQARSKTLGGGPHRPTAWRRSVHERGKCAGMHGRRTQHSGHFEGGRQVFGGQPFSALQYTVWALAKQLGASNLASIFRQGSSLVCLRGDGRRSCLHVPLARGVVRNQTDVEVWREALEQSPLPVLQHSCCVVPRLRDRLCWW
ncbi:hypothetical protein LX32DRAFT_251955 [Colletotrichum zoysiae]|uniref:Uncharacterized protein n=1 Tax=Colletotrichum zoysiae TaxID=1216348 RepID=A0AAD9H4N4_9PEZI|nr:hypothetical protein LX32DRAFT_251955 [Colletotrichum zoysiae]